MTKEFNLLPGPSGFIKGFERYLLKTPISQRSSEFLSCWYNIKNNLKLLLDNPYGDIAILTSSSTGAMEAAIVSLTSKNSKVFVISTGKFGDRFFDICNSFSIPAKKVSFLENRKIDYDLIEKELLTSNFTHITFQICETSSGIFCDPKIIGKLAKKYNLISIADAVSSFTSDYIYQELFSLDAILIGSQKGLNSPSGVSFISLSRKAIEIIKKNNINAYYFNLNRYLDDPPFTPAINTLFYVEQILKEISKLGLKYIIERNIKIANELRLKCQEYGIKQFPFQSSNGVSVFEYEDAENFIEFCKNSFSLYLGHGQGLLKGKVFRVAHFGLTPMKNYYIFNLALRNFFKNNSAKVKN
ncbi:MAG: alanine--glyoxylate aminotransferase family protein [Spirochaetales bacterium]|nr:alanine--glyoxylate aminotransferase family protein [Spirochaetales bacterium]